MPMPCFTEGDMRHRKLGDSPIVTEPHGWTQSQLRSPPDVLMYKPSHHVRAQSLKLSEQTAKGLSGLEIPLQH